MFYSYTCKRDLALYMKLEMGKHTKKASVYRLIVKHSFLIALHSLHPSYLYQHSFLSRKSNNSHCLQFLHPPSGCRQRHYTRYKKNDKKQLDLQSAPGAVVIMENAERQIFALGGKKKNVSDPQKTGSEFQLRPSHFTDCRSTQTSDSRTAFHI